MKSRPDGSLRSRIVVDWGQRRERFDDAYSRWRDPSWRVVVLLAFLALPIVFAGIYAGVLLGRIGRVDVTMSGSPYGGTTYLLVGSDSRAFVHDKTAAKTYGTSIDVPGARADLILLIRVPDGGGKPTLMSVPRDLLVLDRDRGLLRIALSYLDGPQALVDTLCASLGVGVDHFTVLGFQGFADLIDDVGGISLTSDLLLRDLRLRLLIYPGTHQLDGGTALRYIRSRHMEDGNGTTWVPHDAEDDRGARARTVLSAFAAKVHLSPLDVDGTSRLLWDATSAVTVEQSADVFDLWNLSKAVRRVGDAPEVQLPVDAHDGPIPYADLRAGAGDALRPFTGNGSRCRAALPAALPT
ncbi:MAG: hypothetical protein EXQ79_04325 [Acidimicrobiia bacterium]|nr:hypothetical protein [Acidimicrobiia bacterium]